MPVLDLDYPEDSHCDTDMNVVMTGAGGFVEVQGTAEGAPFSRDEMNALLDLAQRRHQTLIAMQKAALEQKGEWTLVEAAVHVSGSLLTQSRAGVEQRRQAARVRGDARRGRHRVDPARRARTCPRRKSRTPLSSKTR